MFSFKYVSIPMICRRITHETPDHIKGELPPKSRTTAHVDFAHVSISN